VVAFVGGETAWSMSEQDLRDIGHLHVLVNPPWATEDPRRRQTRIHFHERISRIWVIGTESPVQRSNKALIFRLLSRLHLPPDHSVIWEDTELPCLPSRT